jgi:1-acyl-sn-glycerol-3-phosphate acyltransferase
LVNVARLIYRLPLLLLLLLALPPTVLGQTSVFRSIHLGGRSLRARILNAWSSLACITFGVSREVDGNFASGAQLVVANHISWLDIMLLHSVSPMGFVAKAEIENWPVAGWISKFGDTVFHRRGSHDSSAGVASVMAERLEQGSKVAIFAEGGILPGDGVKRFHARLFAAALDTGTPVQPVMIRYRQDGRHYGGMTFLPGENFVSNFFRLLMQRGCTAELEILPPIDPHGFQRRDLAGAAEAAVRLAFETGLPESENG